MKPPTIRIYKSSIADFCTISLVCNPGQMSVCLGGYTQAEANEVAKAFRRAADHIEMEPHCGSKQPEKTDATDS